VVAAVWNDGVMDKEQWTQVDRYLVSLLAPSDSALDQALTDSTAAGLPEINVAPNQGKLLQLLASAHGSKRWRHNRLQSQPETRLRRHVVESGEFDRPQPAHGRTEHTACQSLRGEARRGVNGRVCRHMALGARPPSPGGFARSHVGSMRRRHCRNVTGG